MKANDEAQHQLISSSLHEELVEVTIHGVTNWYVMIKGRDEKMLTEAEAAEIWKRHVHRIGKCPGVKA